MTGKIAFEAWGSIDPQYILEAAPDADMAPIGVVSDGMPTKKAKRRPLHSGWVAAIICLFVGLGVYGGMMWLGRNSGRTPIGGTLGEQTTHEEVTLSIDAAMQMYEAAIKGEIYVWDERLGEVKLKSLRFASNNTSLDECKLLTKAILDVDQDGANEFVIQSTDHEHIILRYYNDKVYSYWLDTRAFYKFNTDGTFYWHDPSESVGMACGLSKIVFDSERLNVKSIYSLQYSENPVQYEYFVEGEAVTEDEYDDYRNHNHPKEKMNFSQFEMSCSYPITAEQAWNLANTYWDHQDGRMDGAAGSIYTVRIVLTDTPSSDSEYYRVAFQVERTSNVMEWQECMPPREVQLKDQILIDAFTGEIMASTYKPDGKILSVEEAIEIAQNYRTSMSGDVCNEENGYRVAHIPDFSAPDHVYVIVIQKYDNITNRIWIDKNTGKIIMPYYLYGKG